MTKVKLKKGRERQAVTAEQACRHRGFNRAVLVAVIHIVYPGALVAILAREVLLSESFRLEKFYLL